MLTVVDDAFEKDQTQRLEILNGGIGAREVAAGRGGAPPVGCLEELRLW